MSNPGVVTLETFPIGKTLPVRLEDNLGESIHIHIGPFRTDLTLEQFAELGSSAAKLLEYYLQNFGLTLINFDAKFLSEIAPMLLDLESAEFETVPVADLLVTTKSRFGFRSVQNISSGSVVAALQGDYSSYQRTMSANFDEGLERIDRTRAIVDSGQYGVSGERVILFNDQMLIRDGQHRASVFYTSQPSGEIDIIRLRFRDRRHSIRRPLILESFGNITLLAVKKLLINSLMYVAHFKRRVISKVNYTRNSLRNRSLDR